MDDAKIKRLVITLCVAIAIIMLAKWMLTKTYTNINKAQASKKTAITTPQSTAPPVPAAASPLSDADAAQDIMVTPASAVESTNN